MIIRRRLFTLLESLIAMALTLILLSMLTFFYRQINMISAETETIQKESFKLRYVENRLSQIFPKAVAANTSYKDFYFFTVSDPGSVFMGGSPISLIFTYDNAADKNKLFSNHVLGRLFLDTHKRLCLATWPSPERWNDIGGVPPMKLEILLEGADALAIEFFVPPDMGWDPKFNGEEKEPPPPKKEDVKSPKKNEKNPKAPEPSQADTLKTKVVIKPDREGEWKKDWSQDYQLLPGMVKLTITYQGQKKIYAFPLSQTQRQIVYKM